MICAMGMSSRSLSPPLSFSPTDQTLFGTLGPASPLCNKQVEITNLDNGNTVIVTIVDDCPTCNNEYSIDLSVGAFQALESDLSVGEFPSQSSSSLSVSLFAHLLQVSWVYVS